MRGRDLQESLGQPPQIVLTVPLLLGLDGVEKMSKSLGNYIGFFESTDDQFGKAMSVSDALMWEWYLLLTDKLPAEIEAMKAGHPMDAKKGLAREIVTQFHGLVEAGEAEARWVRRFSERQVDDAPEVPVPATGGEVPLSRLLVARGMAVSRKEAERLISQGAVSLDGHKVADSQHKVDLRPCGQVLVRVGKLKLERWVVK
jgi:tyrosyl-tRNA synthetase